MMMIIRAICAIFALAILLACPVAILMQLPGLLMVYMALAMPAGAAALYFIQTKGSRRA